ncbi:MAG: amidohydrolase [Acidimicrobiia bacterium]|nr:MAG: amidohydrolase [Acidimicrobiia bacterium]
MVSVPAVDSDQHLYEHRTLWLDHVDPDRRDDALRIVDDDLGYAWLTWRGRRLQPVDVQVPGRTAELGERRERIRAGVPAEARYDEVLPRDYWDPVARAARVGAMGFDAAVAFPNFGLLWERTLDADPVALTANMTAWNRWCASVVADARGVVHPVAHLTLRDADWCEAELARLSRDGVRLAMIAPALVDGRPLSHPDHDRLWRAFVDAGVTPVFHVADQRRPFDDAWYTEPDDSFVSPLESVFLWTPAALACTDLILNGTLERHPDLRIGIVELSAIWVPMYLMMLDGGFDFTTRLNGRPIAPLAQRPSDYFRARVRVSSFAYELPGRLIARTGDLYMCCSDFPHSEGTATPLEDYARAPVPVAPGDAPGLFHDNVAFLLGDR